MEIPDDIVRAFCTKGAIVPRDVRDAIFQLAHAVWDYISYAKLMRGIVHRMQLVVGDFAVDENDHQVLLKELRLSDDAWHVYQATFKPNDGAHDGDLRFIPVQESVLNSDRAWFQLCQKEANPRGITFYGKLFADALEYETRETVIPGMVSLIEQLHARVIPQPTMTQYFGDFAPFMRLIYAACMEFHLKPFDHHGTEPTDDKIEKVAWDTVDEAIKVKILDNHPPVTGWEFVIFGCFKDYRFGYELKEVEMVPWHIIFQWIIWFNRRREVEALETAWKLSEEDRKQMPESAIAEEDKRLKKSLESLRASFDNAKRHPYVAVRRRGEPGRRIFTLHTGSHTLAEGLWFVGHEERLRLWHARHRLRMFNEDFPPPDDGIEEEDEDEDDDI